MLFHSAGPRAQSRVTQESWSTPRAIKQGPSRRGRLVHPVGYGPEHDSPMRAGRNRGPSDQGPSGQGQLVDTEFPRTQVRVTRDSWSTPRSLGLGPEAPGTSGRAHEAQGTVPSCLGQLVHPVGPRAWARVARDAWSNTQAIGYGPESPGTAGIPRAHSDPSARLPGQLFDTRALGHCPEFPVTSGRPRGPLEPGPSRPGQLVDPASHRPLACVTQDSESTPWALRTERDSPRRDG